MTQHIFTDIPKNATPFLTREIIQENVIKHEEIILYITDKKNDLLKIKQTFDFLNLQSTYITNLDYIPYEFNSPNPESIFNYFQSLYNLLFNNKAKIIISSIDTLLHKIPKKNILDQAIKNIRKNMSIDRDKLIEELINFGYEQKSIVYSTGDISIRGSILDIATPSGSFRIDFFDDIIDSIRIFDPLTQITKGNVSNICIFPVSMVLFSLINKKVLQSFFSDDTNNIYQSLINKNKYPGQEDYLGIIYENQLISILDTLSHKKITLLLDHIDDDSIQEKIKYIEKKYQHITITNKVPPLKKLFITSILHEKINKKIIITDNSSYKNTINNPYSFSENTGQIPKDQILFKKHIESFDNILFALKSDGYFESVSKLLDCNFYRINNITETLKHKITGTILNINSGFSYNKTLIISENDILQKNYKNRKKSLQVEYLDDFDIGDLVVHKEHGIGIFQGIKKILIAKDTVQYFFMVTYHDNDKLYIPVENISLLYKYGSSEEIKLDKIGSKNWKIRKATAQNRIKIIADELLKTAAIRENIQSQAITISKKSYEEFCNNFPYTETEDQKMALNDIFNDITSSKIMDRLVCGDAGVGKTEVALRTAFIMSKDNINNQVALIAPTTVLANQHYNFFKKRLDGFDVNIVEISRNIGIKKLKQHKEDIKKGKVQIIIGTSAIFKLDFNNLRLLIIDEEQHFGVKEKEFLKKKNPYIDILSMSATPIPRTLQMSLSCIRDITFITTFPKNRIIPKVFVINDDLNIIQEAILKEHNRGGVIFYVCPRIKDIDNIYLNIKDFCDNNSIKIAIAHGKLKAVELENIMKKFVTKEISVMISTNIIQSGIDIPHANTIIVFDAHKFGISQLYQLRGRVGRSNIDSYVYFIKPQKITESSENRLGFLKSINQMNCSFNIASYDMDNRGFGNLIGDNQSGKIKDVGIEMYQKMLQDVVSTKPVLDEVTINVDINRGIPDDYIPDFKIRMQFYKKLSVVETHIDITHITAEMIDRFGKIPDLLHNLIKISTIHMLAKYNHLKSINILKNIVLLTFAVNEKNNHFLKKYIDYILKNNHIYKIKNNNEIHIVQYNKDIQNSIDNTISHLNKFNALK